MKRLLRALRGVAPLVGLLLGVRPAVAQVPAAVAEAESDGENEDDFDESGGYENVSLQEGQLVTPPVRTRFMMGLWWDANLPLGPTRDFVRRVDLAGFQGEGRVRGVAYSGPLRWGVGVAMTWHSMEEKRRSSIESGNATITGTQVRNLSTTTLLGKLTLALGELEQAAPYLGIGIGPSRLLRRLDIGISQFADESWHLALQPEAGIEIPIGPVVGLAAARFNYLVGNANAPEQMVAHFSLGVGFQ